MIHAGQRATEDCAMTFLVVGMDLDGIATVRMTTP